MKKLVSIAVVLFCLFILSDNLYTQVPPPPPDHGSEGGAVGGAAPIGNGLIMLIIMAGSYATLKFRKINKNNEE